MSTATPQTRYTPQDLLRMPDGDMYELVDGHLVERNLSKVSTYVAGEVHSLLNAYAKPNQLGWVFPEGASFQCFRGDTDKVRRADTAFIRMSRMTIKEYREDGHCTIAPDLAVEVVSPNDIYYDVDHKVKEWLEAGVRMVWVVNPSDNYVRVYRADARETVLHEDDEISGEDVIPGFCCKVKEFFATPPGAIAGE